MTKSRKTTIAIIATAIKSIPFVNYILNARKNIILRKALSLYRNNKFLYLAALKQIWLFTFTFTGIVFSLYTNANDPSLIVQITKPLNAFIIFLYPVMYAYYDAKVYARRKKSFLMGLKRKAEIRKIKAEIRNLY